MGHNTGVYGPNKFISSFILFCFVIFVVFYFNTYSGKMYLGKMKYWNMIKPIVIKHLTSSLPQIIV